MIRWAELCLDSMVSGENTKFGLVFHTEGLVDERIVRELMQFGRDVSPVFRPMLTTVTPICPMYLVSPLLDPLRVELPKIPRSQKAEADFAERIQGLAEHYDIGYHGHFFKSVDGGYRPTFNFEEIIDQFKAEQQHLRDIGLAPKAYAGGWWHITPQILSLMADTGINVDTTINDLRLDSFSRKQPFPSTSLGKAFWATQEVLEIPSVRSFFNLFFGVAIEKRRATNYVIIALHDYDLISDVVGRPIRKLIGRLLRADRIASILEIARRATSELREGAVFPALS
jgi:hypothetical protein